MCSIMVSNDFKDIMQKIHTEKYRVVGTNIHAERKDVSANLDVEASIILEKEGKQITIQTIRRVHMAGQEAGESLRSVDY